MGFRKCVVFVCVCFVPVCIFSFAFGPEACVPLRPSGPVELMFVDQISRALRGSAFRSSSLQCLLLSSGFCRSWCLFRACVHFFRLLPGRRPVCLCALVGQLSSSRPDLSNFTRQSCCDRLCHVRCNRFVVFPRPLSQAVKPGLDASDRGLNVCSSYSPLLSTHIGAGDTRLTIGEYHSHGTAPPLFHFSQASLHHVSRTT